MKLPTPRITLVLGLALTVHSPTLLSQSFFEGGTVSGIFNLRYEHVEQDDNALRDADALTLSSRLAYTTRTVNGFSAMVEVKDIRTVAGVDDYSVGPSGFKPGRYSTIADPETTEVHQGFLQYSNDLFTAKMGRQLITYDNHRFVGNVGWRQDQQTFDAVTLTATPIEGLNLSYNYIDERERIFAEDADIDSEDHLIHATYDTPIGTLTGYAYLLELQDGPDNSLDTYGLRLTGNREINGFDVSYLLEYADQESETSGGVDYDADYYRVEGGVTLGGVNLRLGYEEMGSDDALYGFATPLATLHAHNGWGDMFLGTPAEGLTDAYLSVSGQVFSGNWTVVYHEFDTDDSSPLVNDLGDEWDLQYVYPISEFYTLGMKYARYSSGDIAAGKSDTDKFWVWLTARF
ncbi:MAG: alginate export family protein [Gammaproteobacteria bacterium]|nr:alginate export family protein [Gammaproteobacteria bacterium]